MILTSFNPVEEQITRGSQPITNIGLQEEMKMAPPKRGRVYLKSLRRHHKGTRSGFSAVV